MTDEELNQAIDRLLAKSESPENTGRGRRYRRKMHSLKNTRLYNKLIFGSIHNCCSKHLSALIDAWYLGDARIVKSIHGTGVYIKGNRTHKKRNCKKISIRKFRRYKGDVSDGSKFYRLVFMDFYRYIS